MKRWFLLALALIVVTASLLIIHARLVVSSAIVHSPVMYAPVVLSHLVRVPNSAYKYHLCAEAYAYAMATPDNPYKTDDTFLDPFRHVNDTIIPRFLGFNKQGDAVSFSVKMIINHVGTFNETISDVRGLDGISVLIPDTQNKLQHSSVPQFIISYLPNAHEHGNAAVLDYTCPEQWVWTAFHT